MLKQNRRRHDAHTRTQGVCTEHSAIFDATPGGKTMREALGTHVADVARLFALQEQSIAEQRAGTFQIRKARAALRDAALAVVRVGKLVNLADTTMATLELPGAPSHDELIAYSQGLLDRVSAYADKFVAKGLPPNLLPNLADAIRALVAAREGQASARQRFAAASESIHAALSGADATVDALEAIAVNTPEARPEVLTKLRVAKRVGPRSVDASAKPAPTTPPASSPTDKAA